MNERRLMTTTSCTSLRPNPKRDRPRVDSSAYVDPSAQIIGNVRLGPCVYVGPNAVIRADETDFSSAVAPIEIGPECNVQDGVIIHALGGAKVTVGRRSSLTHGCIVHGPCTLGTGCFVGFGAKVFDAEMVVIGLTPKLDYNNAISFCNVTGCANGTSISSGEVIRHVQLSGTI